MNVKKKPFIWDRLEAHFKLLAEKETQPALSQEMLRARLAARAKALGDSAPKTQIQDFFESLFFRIGQECYALRLEDAESIHALSNFTTLPSTPPFIRGIARVRDEVLSLLDIGLFLGMQRKGLADLRRVIVIGKGQRKLALLAGDMEEICRVQETALRQPPQNSIGTRESCAEGVIGNDRLLLSAREILKQVETGGNKT